MRKIDHLEKIANEKIQGGKSVDGPIERDYAEGLPLIYDVLWRYRENLLYYNYDDDFTPREQQRYVSLIKKLLDHGCNPDRYFYANGRLLDDDENTPVKYARKLLSEAQNSPNTKDATSAMEVMSKIYNSLRENSEAEKHRELLEKEKLRKLDRQEKISSLIDNSSDQEVHLQDIAWEEFDEIVGDLREQLAEKNARIKIGSVDQGEEHIWYTQESDVINEVARYQNGALSCKTILRNGRTEIVENYENGELSQKKILRTGRDGDGEVELVENYKNNVLDGVRKECYGVRYYEPRDAKVCELLYNGDKRRYHDDRAYFEGYIIEENYKDGNLDGERNVYGLLWDTVDCKQPLFTESYKNGKLDGFVSEYRNWIGPGRWGHSKGAYHTLYKKEEYKNGVLIDILCIDGKDVSCKDVLARTRFADNVLGLFGHKRRDQETLNNDHRALVKRTLS